MKDKTFDEILKEKLGHNEETPFLDYKEPLQVFYSCEFWLKNFKNKNLLPNKSAYSFYANKHKPLSAEIPSIEVQKKEPLKFINIESFSWQEQLLLEQFQKLTDNIFVQRIYDNELRSAYKKALFKFHPDHNPHLSEPEKSELTSALMDLKNLYNLLNGMMQTTESSCT